MKQDAAKTPVLSEEATARAVAQLEVELLAALRAVEAGDEEAAEVFLRAAHISLCELRDGLLLQGLLEEGRGER